MLIELALSMYGQHLYTFYNIYKHKCMCLTNATSLVALLSLIIENILVWNKGKQDMQDKDCTPNNVT